MLPPPKRRKPRPVLEEILAIKAEAHADAAEILSHVYEILLKTPAFTLKNGMTCRVDPLYAPEADSGNDLKCAFDSLLGDFGHLKFPVANTG